MDIADFEGKQPALKLERFFAGRSEGWGVMQSRFGALQRQFRIEAAGQWDPETATLHLTETYRFDDGQVDELKWRIRRPSDHRYVGEEPRVVGAADGSQAGNAFHWAYVRDVPGPDGDSRLHFDDWFWLQPGEVLIIRASVSKFGVELATLSVFYRKPGG